MVNKKLSHPLWPESDKHPFKWNQLAPSLLDILFSATLNVPLEKNEQREDRLDALICFAQGSSFLSDITVE